MRKPDEVLAQLVRWAEDNENIRAVVLGGSLANPYAFTDIFSDCDPMLFVTDTSIFSESDAWMRHFGEKIAWFKDENPFRSMPVQHYTRLVLYEDGVKIDFSIWPVETIAYLKGLAELPDFLDNGYKVLVDKDGLTAGLKEPSYAAYVTTPPTEAQYLDRVKGFLWDLSYVAKSLWRDELYFAKFMVDNIIRFGSLQKMIEWYIGVQHDWAVNPNKCGRWFKRYLDGETWCELETTFAGADVEENWQALFNLTRFFRRIAHQVADSLGYRYPMDQDAKMMKYLHKVRNMCRENS